jgi:hypothetical protein
MTLPPPLETLASQLEVSLTEAAFNVQVLRPLLSSEIGYAVVPRRAILFVFGGFLATTVIVYMVIRRTRWPEAAGWLAPAAALGASGILFMLGESSHRAVAPTLAVAQIVHPAAGTNEAGAHGLLAVYRPESGLAEAGARQGGFFDLDMTGVQGRSRRLALLGMSSWQWENLSLPAGIRLAPFWCTIPTASPITARAHFGPTGLQGKLAAGVFQDASDPLLVTEQGRNMAPRLDGAGAFTCGAHDVLAEGQFLAGTVLSDRQQQHQAIYRQHLRRSPEGGLGGPVLLAWAKPVDMQFTLSEGARLAGSALLVVPVQLERSAPGERVTIPGSFLECRSVFGKRLMRVLREFAEDVDMHLRFQLPRITLPFQVERARLRAKIHAPGRRFAVTGFREAGCVELYHAESPDDPVEIDINDPILLRLDADGGMHLGMSLTKSDEDQARDFRSARKLRDWKIDYVELEVSGRAEKLP